MAHSAMFTPGGTSSRAMRSTSRSFASISCLSWPARWSPGAKDGLAGLVLAGEQAAGEGDAGEDAEVHAAGTRQRLLLRLAR